MGGRGPHLLLPWDPGPDGDLAGASNRKRSTTSPVAPAAPSTLRLWDALTLICSPRQLIKDLPMSCSIFSVQPGILGLGVAQRWSVFEG